LVNVVLMSAIQKGASDIHIEPYEKELRVRYRIDGILYNIMAPPMKYRDAIVSRVKIMSKLDIAEKRLPQDGRIKIRFNESGIPKEIDFRVSVLPTLFGEKIVMRLLDKDKLMLDMTRLGFEPESLEKFETRDSAAVGHGAGDRPDRQRQDQHALLVDSKINTPETNIMTAEDPVEFNLAGINQVQGEGKHRPELRGRPALVLAAGPRTSSGRRNSRLRNRGNRRESRAHRPSGALDAPHQRCAEHDQPLDEHGHRTVPGRQLGALDLRAAPGAPRLRQLQRAASMAPPALLQAGFTQDEANGGVTPMKGKGCERCNNTGYKGRVGLYEVMEVTEELRELILVGASGLELRRKAIRRRNDHAAPQRTPQSDGRHDDG
jgi:type IV pilus assembly protein PilB